MVNALHVALLGTFDRRSGELNQLTGRLNGRCTHVNLHQSSITSPNDPSTRMFML